MELRENKAYFRNEDTDSTFRWVIFNAVLFRNSDQICYSQYDCT